MAAKFSLLGKNLSFHFRIYFLLYCYRKIKTGRPQLSQDTDASLCTTRALCCRNFPGVFLSRASTILCNIITVCLQQEDEGTAQTAAQTRYIPAAKIRASWIPFLALFLLWEKNITLLLLKENSAEVTVPL